MPPAAKPMRPRRRTLRSLPKRRIDINTEAIDFKNTELLKKFLTEKGRILPRRITGMTSSMRSAARAQSAASRAWLMACAVSPLVSNQALARR